MRLVWTKSTRLSKNFDFISWGLEEPVGHFAIGFFTTEKRYLHWSFKGFLSESEKEFTKKRIIVFEKEYPLDLKDEMHIHDTMKHKYRGSLYDYVYLMWLIWRGILLKLLNKPIPYGEPFGETNYNMICHEALEGLPDHVRPEYDRDRANTPYRLALELGLKFEK